MSCGRGAGKGTRKIFGFGFFLKNKFSDSKSGNQGAVKYHEIRYSISQTIGFFDCRYQRKKANIHKVRGLTKDIAHIA
jgi:hypothetical protein